ncbi:hypothetical protein [Flagellimonas marina]|uniref:Uncharacterized protein n=1 Tax=Flagellimonas marina TaxID=1775168 RepID=A0ABV8PGS8_9FLAO
MKIHLGKSKRQIDLRPYPAVNENDIYIEAFEGDKMLDGITIPKSDWENRIEALQRIKEGLEKRFCKEEKIFQPKNYEEFVEFCQQEGLSPGSLEAKQKLKGFSAEVEDFFD